MVKYHIESENFETGEGVIVTGEAGVVRVLECWIAGNHSLYYNVVNVRPDMFQIVVFFLQPVV